jgi:hypothetical protein
MAAETHDGREMTLDEMMALRAATEAVSAWLRREVEDRLECLRPLMLPRRHLGDHVKSPAHEDVKEADKNFADLQAAYRDVSGAPFKLPSRLDSPIDSLPTSLALHPWEYSHEARGGAESKPLTVRSPLSWILMHAAPLSFSQARQMLAGEAGRSDADLRQFVLSALVTKLVFDRNPPIPRMLAALRLRVDFVTCPETAKLPLVRLTAPFPTFRPADALILRATKLSGIPIFEELLDLEAARAIEDPLKAKVVDLTA